MSRISKRPRSPLVSLETTEIAIIGSGLAALSTAIRLEQAGFQRLTVYERDHGWSSRREGYGLTLKYDPKGVLQQLGILEACARADCPSRSHYLLQSNGHVLGYFGNAFTPEGGYGQRGNLRVPRQVVRKILMDALIVTKIEWNHRLECIETVHHDDSNAVKMRLSFHNHDEPVLADWVIGADGIRSTVVDCILPKAPPPQPMGVRLILGLTSETTASTQDSHHSLLHERGFYSLANGHRLFVMPYSASSPLHPDQETRYMWQLSFVEDTAKANSAPKTPQQLWQEANERCRDWHSPVQDLIQSTPLDAIWSTHLCDRNPQQLQELLLQHITRQQGTASNPAYFDRVIFMGDALHAMSCFKGQGANQALLDGIVVAKWFDSAARGTCQSPLALVRGCHREMVQRTAPIVQASREAALYWHSPAVLQEDHVFAGVPADRVSELKKLLTSNKIGADSVPDLDKAIQTVLKDMGLVAEHGHPSPSSMTVPADWVDAVVQAVSKGQLEALRELSWSARNSLAIRTIVLPSGDSCLHIAARTNHLELIYWLATQAGCDALAQNGEHQTPRDVACDDRVADLLNRIEAHHQQKK